MPLQETNFGAVFDVEVTDRATGTRYTFWVAGIQPHCPRGQEQAERLITGLIKLAGQHNLQVGSCEPPAPSQAIPDRTTDTEKGG